MPVLVEWNILKAGGSLWLPNVSHTTEMVNEYCDVLSRSYIWELVSDPTLNPLYAATERVTDELTAASPKAILTNATQLPYLDPQPFYKFTARNASDIPSTPSTSAAKRQRMSPGKRDVLKETKKKLFK